MSFPHYIRVNRPLTALFHHVTDAMSLSSWQADDVFPMLQLMGAVRTEKLQLHNCAKWVEFKVAIYK